MTYTIEELERVVDGWNAEDEAILDAIDDMSKIALARQLLDTMRKYQETLDMLAEYESAVAATLDIMPMVIQECSQWNVARKRLNDTIMKALDRNNHVHD